MSGDVTGKGKWRQFKRMNPGYTGSDLRRTRIIKLEEGSYPMPSAVTLAGVLAGEEGTE